MENIGKLTTLEMQKIIHDILHVYMKSACEDDATEFSMVSENLNDIADFCVKNHFLLLSFPNTNQDVREGQILISGRKMNYKVDFTITRKQLLRDLLLLKDISQLLLKEGKC